MDKEKARFILRSFRPDGEDVGDHDFAEALALAAEDRELGEWLAGERSRDAEFAKSLRSVEIPETLRQDILGCLAGERGDFPQAKDAGDAAWIGALASIKPPPMLRQNVLTAMERSVRESRPKKSVWTIALIPLAAAAGVALAFFLNRPAEPMAPLADAGKLPVDVVQAGFIRTFESPLFSLDVTKESNQALINHLRSRKLPCPAGCLPKGLKGVKGIGCREIVIDGKRGSLICFDEREAGVVHLVVFHRKDVSGTLPESGHPVLSQDGSWAAARWEHDQKVFVLMGHTELRKLAALF